MNKRYLLLFIFFLFTINASAASFKKYAGEFLSLGAGSRSLAMGGAYTAAANDVTAGYWNPSGLVDSRGLQIEFMYSNQFISSINYNYLGASLNMNDGSAFGISLIYFNISGIKDSRYAYDIVNQKVDPTLVKTFNTGDYAALFSYARRYNERFSYGVNLKVIYRDYYTETAFGLGFDAGAKYKLAENLMLGAMLRDISTTMIAWSTSEKEFISPSARLGVSYVYHINNLNLAVQPSADFNILFENRSYASQMHLGPMSIDTFWGLEVAYHNLLALRIGYDDLNRLNTGIGFTVPYMSFNYSFTAYESELGNVHRISVQLSFADFIK